MGITHLSGLEVGGVPVFGSGTPIASYYGTQWFVDTVNGSNGYDGRSPSTAFATIGRALFTDTDQTTANVGPNDTIWFVGTNREQLIAPLATPDGVAITGVQIIGAAQGGVRDDDGAKWTYPASGATAGKALLSLRQQGWVLRNFLMTPEPQSGACVQLNRQENATYPDSSHFIATGMRFVGIDVTTTYGIQDIGGCSNVQLYNNEFFLLTTGIYCSSTSIATPYRYQVTGNRFLQNTNDIVVPSSYCLYQNNRHMTDNTVVINIASGGNNTVTGNVFPNGNADIDPAHGYDGNATDIWTGNLVTDQAAYVYGDPA